MAESVKHIPCPSCGTELKDTREPVLQCWFCAHVFLADWQERKHKRRKRKPRRKAA